MNEYAIDSAQRMLTTIITTQDKAIFLSIIDRLNQLLFEVKGVSIEFLKEGYPKAMQDYFTELILEKKTLHPNKFRDLLVIMKKTAESLPVLTISIPFDPSDQFILYLSSFFRSAISNSIIVNIQKRPSMEAGIILETKGLYRDYSLSTILTQFFKDHQSEIAGMIR